MRVAAFVPILLSVTIACAPSQSGNIPEAGSLPNPIEIATKQCTDIAAGIPGLNSWVDSVRSADGVTTSLLGVMPSDVLDRRMGYELIELNYAFDPIRKLLLDSADEIRAIGPDCIKHFDAAIQLGDNLPLIGAAIIMCTMAKETWVTTWTCPSIQLEKWRTQLISDLVTSMDAPVSPPTPEYLASLGAWSPASNDLYSLGANISTSAACNTASGFLQALTPNWIAWVATVDYSLEDEHNSPLSTLSLSKTGPVHQLWEQESDKKGDDAMFENFKSLLNSATKNYDLAKEMRDLVLSSNAGIESLCLPLTTEVENLVGPADRKVPANSLGLGSLGSVVAGFTGCSKASFRKQEAKKMGNPMLTEQGMCIRLLYFGGFVTVTEHYVGVHNAASLYSHYVSVSEALE